MFSLGDWGCFLMNPIFILSCGSSVHPSQPWVTDLLMVHILLFSETLDAPLPTFFQRWHFLGVCVCISNLQSFVWFYLGMSHPRPGICLSNCCCFSKPLYWSYPYCLSVLLPVFWFSTKPRGLPFFSSTPQDTQCVLLLPSWVRRKPVPWSVSPESQCCMQIPVFLSWRRGHFLGFFFPFSFLFYYTVEGRRWDMMVKCNRLSYLVLFISLGLSLI